MNIVEVLGAKTRSELVEKTKAALMECNLCTDKVVMEFPDGMWGSELRDIVRLELRGAIEANLKRNGGFMCDAQNFSITGQELIPIYSRFGIK